jgi:hypothetical protein
LEEEKDLGMNTMKSSSKVLLLYYLYSNANELDYSSRVMIMIYELVYSLCVMISMLGILNANRKIRKRMDTNVAFTCEYSKVSIFYGEHEVH